MASATVEKEFYLHTYEQLIERLGKEAATAKAEFYIEFLQKYPGVKVLVNCPLLKTYQSNPK
ncbi:hypothetical protein GXP67_21205 [Rhodocytophaga rosea]|uniref:Uncharacterized protein n=1 Tax=Rhodocytophaga rosea TaxID=2704465 RepID=A0A6C0GLW0_9BACT|nr:hypothetical protein [Rhodocytophaga rosea]QHT68989.1 hypothetical protein GXP67_21205 [Rhodocytophaga rosea]